MTGQHTTIRLATADDAAAIAVLSRETVEQGLGWKWTARRVKRAIDNRSTNVAVAESDGTLEGFGIMQYADGSANLDLLAVQPHSRRRGTGRAIVRWLERVAVTAGILHLYVQLRQNNDIAHRFYSSMGYQVIDAVPGYYRGLESAAIMYRYCGVAVYSDVDLPGLLPAFRRTGDDKADS